MDNYDIYIVGGGLAGLILFKELKKRKKNVCLFESNLNELNDGYLSNESLDHTPLNEYRARGLGGTGKKWGGGCTLFEREDFEKWEIDYDDFLKYYKKACDILNINFEILNGTCKNDIFNKELISDKFKASLNLITTVNGKNVLNKILSVNEFDEYKKDIFYYTLLRFENGMMVLNDDKNEIKLNYKKCILCCGGLETTRVLMHSNLNNNNIGKYYSPHLSLRKGVCVLNKNIIKNNMYFNGNGVAGSKYFIYKSKDNILIRVALQDNLDLILQGDQTPYYDSQLSLSDDKDKFNSHKLILNFKSIKKDFERILECYKDFDYELRKNNIGYLRDIPTIENINKFITGGSHHMGTTRFGKTASNGVVDYNFKVFGLNNVYVLSTSLFPTYSHAHPTLTLVSLVYYFLNIHYEK